MEVQKEISDPKLIVAVPAYTPKDWQPGDASGIGNFGPETKIIGPDGIPTRLHNFFTRVGVDIPLACKVVFLARKSPEAVILTQNESIGLILSIIRRFRLLPNPFMVWNHGALSRGPMGVKAALTWLGSYDIMVTLSKEEKAGFEKMYNVSPEKVVCNPAPVNIAEYLSQGEVKEDKPIVSAFGVSDRDYLTIIKAAEMLPDITFIIDPTSPSVPSGDLSWIKNVPDNVQIKLNLDHEGYKDMIGRSRFVILAIRKGVSQISAGCTLVTSAASMRKPTVAATEGLREYVRDRKTGFLVEPECPEKLAEKIRYLIDNPEKCRIMGQNARKFMEEEFSSEACVRRFKAMAAELRKKI